MTSLIDIFNAYGLKHASAVRCFFTKDEVGWITVHPHGEGTKGQPVKIEKRTGEILGGLGGKFNGEHISALPEHGKHEQHGAQALIKWYNETQKKPAGGTKKSGANNASGSDSTAKPASKTDANWKKNHGNTVRDKKVYPDNFVGKYYSKEMTHKEADSGKVNPNYGKGEPFKVNCQACVVAYEMRRRGYDVEALGQSKEFRDHYWDVFKEPSTGRRREFTFIPAGNVGEKKKYAFLDGEVRSGNRYFLYVLWKGCKSAHVVTISRNQNNELEIYDPQIDRSQVGKAAVTDYLKGTARRRYSVAVIRSDDVEFDQAHAKHAFAW